MELEPAVAGRKRPSVATLIIAFAVFLVFGAAIWPFALDFAVYSPPGDRVVPTVIAAADGAVVAALVVSSLDDLALWSCALLMWALSLPAAIWFALRLGERRTSVAPADLAVTVAALVAGWVTLAFVPQPAARRKRHEAAPPTDRQG